MLATVEGSRGDVHRASQILAESPHAEHPWTLYLRGRLARDHDEAIRLLSRSLERTPALYAPRVTLGRLLFRRAEWDAGIEQLERALSERPWDDRVRSELRTAVRMRGPTALE